MEPKLTGRGILEPELLNTGGPRALKHASERLLAKSYGLMYDAVVSGFPPYETLLDEVFAYLERSAPVRAGGPQPAVLDISCGVGHGSPPVGTPSPALIRSATWSTSRGGATAAAGHRCASKTSTWRARPSPAPEPLTWC
jgi:hypothetical protein